MGVALTGKMHEGTFWGDGNVQHFDQGDSYMREYRCKCH